MAGIPDLTCIDLDNNNNNRIISTKEQYDETRVPHTNDNDGKPKRSSEFGGHRAFRSEYVSTWQDSLSVSCFRSRPKSKWIPLSQIRKALPFSPPSQQQQQHKVPANLVGVGQSEFLDLEAERDSHSQSLVGSEETQSPALSSTHSSSRSQSQSDSVVSNITLAVAHQPLPSASSLSTHDDDDVVVSPTKQRLHSKDCSQLQCKSKRKVDELTAKLESIQTIHAESSLAATAAVAQATGIIDHLTLRLQQLRQEMQICLAEREQHHRQQVADLSCKLLEAEQQVVVLSNCSDQAVENQNEGGMEDELDDFEKCEKQLAWRRMKEAQRKQAKAEQEVVEIRGRLQKSHARERDLLKEHEIRIKQVEKERDDIWLEMGECIERNREIPRLQTQIRRLRQRRSESEDTWSTDCSTGNQ